MATRILVPLDGSETAERVLPYATGLARQMGSTLHVVRVVSGSGTVPPEVGVGQAAPFGGPVVSEADPTGRDNAVAGDHQARDYVQNVGSQLKAEGVSTAYEVRRGEPVDELLRAAEEQGVEMIAIATHGRTGLGRTMFGSVADELLRRSGRPVMIVKAAA